MKASFVLAIGLGMLVPCYDATAAESHVLTEERGLALATELRTQKPAETFTSSGMLRSRDSNGRWRAQIPVQLEVKIGVDSWQSVYRALDAKGALIETLVVTHYESSPNRYEHWQRPNSSNKSAVDGVLTGEAAAVPFAESDFWLSDLGLEFLHWPGQRLAGHEMRKGRACYILESVNPSQRGSAYARVRSWVDTEHRGILRAEAYDSSNKLVKEFSVGSFKKVDGKWQLKSMEIRDERTDARTRLEFDLEFEER